MVGGVRDCSSFSVDAGMDAREDIGVRGRGIGLMNDSPSTES